MKSFGGLLDQMLNEELIRKCILKASRGKRNRKEVKRVLSRMNESVAKIKEIILTNSYCPRPHTPKTITERGKERQIVKPDFFPESVIQHLIVAVLEPILMPRFYEYSCASIPRRGSSFGKRHLERMIRKIQNGNRRRHIKTDQVYCLKIDITKYFASINCNILKRMLSRLIRDKDFLNLCFITIDNCPVSGLPLGYVTSQWFANYYLTPLDIFLKQDLCLPYIVRYMDDVVILHHSKRRLHHTRRLLNDFLHEKLFLGLKGNWQVFKVSSDCRKGRAIDFMGFKFYLNRTTLRKKSLKLAHRKAIRVYRKESPSVRDARQLLSRLGAMKQCQTHGYFTHYIKPFVNVKALRKTVSTYDRRIVA